MSFAAAEKIADAVLFEGYMLYPYRPSSLKNRQRWNFGTLYPRVLAEAQRQPQPCSFHAEMLLSAPEQAQIDVRMRFLQLIPQPGGDAAPGAAPWQVGLVRSRTIAGIPLSDLAAPVDWALDLTALSDEERARAPQFYAGPPCMAWLQLQAVRLHDKHFRLQVTLSNESPLAEEDAGELSQARASAFTSAHLLLHCAEGNFVSLLDPTAELAAAASACRNQGIYPVLAGDAEGHTMLCSPIILYDHPQIAPESAGDFFDATEMDEMLSLRILTLTDEEKREMRASDPLAKAILERVETMANEKLLGVHGVIRDVAAPDRAMLAADQSPQSAAADEREDSIAPWDPFADTTTPQSVRVFGMEVRKGDRVRLWPQKRADILDAVMEGRVAVVEAIEQDLEGNLQFAVVLEDDPGKDMGMLRQAGHRFFFSPEEVEPITLEAQ